jgi:hypothetical protein
MKTKRISGVIIAGHPTRLSEPTRRFLRGLLVFMLAVGSLIALSARGQTNYTGESRHHVSGCKISRSRLHY